MSPTDSVSVILVTFNSQGTIERCVRSIPRSGPELAVQVIVVDNGSTDGTLESVRQSIPDAVILQNETNLGFAAACNQGAESATGEWLFFLNPDVVLDTDSLNTLITTMKRMQRVGLASMRLRFPDGSFQANCRNFPTVTNLLFSRGSVMGRLLWSRLDPKATTYTLADFPDVTAVPAVSATAAAINRELFRSMHRFDSRYFMYMEDTDLCYRLHLHKHQNLFVPRAGAIHEWGKGAEGGKITRAWHHHQSVLKYFLKFQPTGFALIVLPAILIVNFLVVCLLPQRRK
ncbi:MAG: glycosyltransferase family 2 protein [candidate division Zixibacteria bacterium]|nr:glycosyltransferase family 2 protein [candidate division Zixibacteria bacterium]